MGNSGKMEESRKQRQTNLRKSHRSGVVFVCGHDELRNENQKSFGYIYLCWEKRVWDNEQYCEHLFLGKNGKLFSFSKQYS